MPREKIAAAKSGNNYFTSQKTGLKFVSTGCTKLDCDLGGGLVLGRIANIVGDKSTAKTGIANECLINFIIRYPDGRGAYRETEAAYDHAYAEAMGLPLDKVDFGDEDKPLITVEDFARDLDSFIEAQTKANKPGLYVLDSLDALSDEAEMEKDIGEGTYGMAKAKQLSIMFRKIARKLERSQVLLIIVSQVRDNINAMAFGEKQRRSGGKALDFYASQVIWLAHTKILNKTINSIERPYGVSIRARIKKNKISMPFREADFDFLFGYGVDDVGANIKWLKEINRFKDLTDGDPKDYIKRLNSLTDDEYRAEQQHVAELVKQIWVEVEETFLPKRAKYS